MIALVALGLAMGAGDEGLEKAEDSSPQSARSGWCQKARERRAQRLDPFSDWNLQRYADEIVPLVEEAAGRRFEPIPEVTWVDPEELGELIADETRQIYKSAFPDVTEEQVEAMAEAAHYQLGGILGKFTPKNGTVHINRDVIRMAAAELSLDTNGAVDMARLILAHELVHAMQDQVSPVFDALLGVRNEDHFQAIRAAEEGQATLLERRVAERLDLIHVHRAMCRLQGWNGEELIDRESFDIWAIYGLGMRFVEEVTAGHEPEWAWSTLYTHPPTRTSMLFRPETYAPDVPPAELETRFDGVTEALTKGQEWSEVRSPLPEMELWKEALYAEEGRVEEVLSHLEHADHLAANLSDREAEVRVLRFDSAQNVGPYLDLLAQQELGVSKDRAAAMGLPVEIVVNDLTDVGGDRAFVRIETYVTGSRRGPGLERELYVVARDRTVVLLTVFGFRPGLRAGRAIEQVFANLAAP